MVPGPFRSRWLRPLLIGALVMILIALSGVALYTRALQTAAAERGASAYTPPAVVQPTPSYGDVVRRIASLPRGSRAYFFGDSYVNGYGASDAATRSFVPLVAKHFGWRYTRNAAGGTGYVNPGPSKQTYLQRLRRVQPFDADVVFISGGLNDEEQRPSSVVAAAEDVVKRFERLAPGAQLVVIGPFNPYLTPEPSLAAVDRALRQFAADRGLPYVDAYLYGIADYTQNDKRHPNDAGYALIAKKLEAFIRSCVDA